MPLLTLPTVMSLHACAPAAHAGNHCPQATQARSVVQQNDVASLAARSEDFTVLTRALEVTGLDDVLMNADSVTVFAPTDDAFARLGTGRLELLLAPENRHELERILLYHVLDGEVRASEASRRNSADTLAQARVTLAKRRGTLRVDRAKVVTADVEADNGVIHAIDRVLLPPSETIAQTASAAEDFEVLVAAAKTAGLWDEIAGHGPVTVFAPTDDAFSKLPRASLQALLRPDRRSDLLRLLENHVVSGRVYADQAVGAGSLTSIAHDELLIGVRDGRATVNGARLINTDIQAVDGVVHVIDRVLLPQA